MVPPWPPSPSSTRSASASSSSTVPSAPTCRASTSAPTTSAARSWRAATSTSSCRDPTSSRGCTRRSSPSASTRSRPRPSAPSPSCSPSTGCRTRPTPSTWRRPALARQVADDHGADGRTRYVAGSIGPGTKLPSLGHIRFAELRDAYEEQARALVEGGCDLLLIETCMDLLQAKAAVIGGRRAMAAAGRQVPIQLQVTMETTGRMLVGSEIGAALTALGALKPDVFGINCATGPREMTEHLRYLSRHAPMPISVLPNAGLPSVVDGHTHYDLTPSELAEFHTRFITELGVGVVGGCCGTTPEHLAHVVAAVRDLTPATRTPLVEPSVASIYSPVPIEQDNSFLIIGERTNANGSKAFREAMLATDWDTCLRMANDQIREGAHVLDVCVDYVGPQRRARHGRDRQPVRHPGQRPAGARLHRDPGAGGGARAHRRPGHPELGQPGGRRAARQPHGPGVLPRPRARVRGHLPAHRRAGPGPRHRVEAGDRPPHPPDRQRALRPRRRATSSSTPSPSRSRPATTTCAGTRCTPSTPSGASRPRSPGAFTTLGVSNVSFGLQPGGAPRAEQRVPARVRAGRPRLGHRARRAHHAPQQDPRRAARRVPRPHLRPAPPGRRRRGRLRPAHRGCSRCSPT